MTNLSRTLLLVLSLAIPPGGLAEAQEDSVPTARPEASGAVDGAADEAVDDDLLEVMLEEIRLREELAAMIRDGAPEPELEALRGALDRLENSRRALEAREASVPADVARGEAEKDPVAATAGRSGRRLDWWRFIGTFSDRYRFPLAAVAFAIFLRLAAGWRVRRWLASTRALLPEREDAAAADPRWRQAEEWILRSISIAILAGLLAVLAIESGLLSGATVAILLASGLAVPWIFRRLVEDAIGGLTLLRAGAYQVGDLVDLADRSGVVETCGLFSTTLRDTDGSVHFIPHRLVRGVRNSTYDWARAVVEVAVKPDEDLDRIMNLLLEVARDVAQSPPFDEMVLEEPRMLGIESIDASRVAIRFFLKTAARRRNMVKREVQRRVSQRFRELGIEPPLPAQTLHHRIEKPASGRGAD